MFGSRYFLCGPPVLLKLSFVGVNSVTTRFSCRITMGFLQRDLVKDLKQDLFQEDKRVEESHSSRALASRVRNFTTLSQRM
jgi:hypothetical protein